MNWTQTIEPEYIGLASVVLTVVAFIFVFVYCRAKEISISLQDLMTRALAASSIPTALVILACSMDLSLIGKLKGVLQVYIALAGLALAYISLSSVFAPLGTTKAAPAKEKDGTEVNS